LEQIQVPDPDGPIPAAAGALQGQRIPSEHVEIAATNGVDGRTRYGPSLTEILTRKDREQTLHIL
jgi:hypothetical protein